LNKLLYKYGVYLFPLQAVKGLWKEVIETSVAEPHHVNEAPALGKIFDVAPAPTLVGSKPTFFKSTKVT
jgi:hypothetical protein